MRQLVIFVLVCGSAFAANTRILDTISTPFGFPYSGKIDIVCPAGKTAGGATIRQWRKTVTVTSGVFDQSIDPGDAGSPIGRYCSVTYRPDSGPQSSATWYVPTSGTPLKITDVEVAIIPTPGLTLLPSQIDLTKGYIIAGDANNHGAALARPSDGACYGLSYSSGIASFVPCATVTTPASAAAACTTGQVAFDSNFAYFCIAPNTWKRVAIATW